MEKHSKHLFFRNVSMMVIGCLLMPFLMATPAEAADKKDKAAKRAAMMVQAMKQQMEQEKAAMQAQMDQQKKDFESKIAASEEALKKQAEQNMVLKKKLSQAQNDIQKLEAEKTALDAKLTSTQTALDATKTQLTDLTTEHQKALADLQFNENQRKTLSGSLAKTNRALNDCGEKNQKLYSLGAEVVGIYDKPSAYQAAMRNEQFFQLKRVELENVLQGYQDKMIEQKFDTQKAAN